MSKEMIAIISRNNMAHDMFGKGYNDLDETEKMSIDEMFMEMPELWEE